MTNQDNSVLWEEYKVISGSFEALSRVPYTVISIAVVMVAALLGTKRPESAFAVLMVAYGLDLLVIALAFIHSCLSLQILRLVELETIINRIHGAKGDEGLAWYSRIAGTFFTPGYRCAVALVSVLGLFVMAISLIEGWKSLDSEGVDIWVRLIFTLFPVILLPCALASMFFEELRTSRRKRAILQEEQKRKRKMEHH